ncbi:hypothetical protein M8C21_005342, partial [Ambrosia artemisiifolia]
IRALWRYYYKNTHALIFVVDSNNKRRIYQARNELHRLLNEQDLPNAMNVSEVADKLKLHTISQRRCQITLFFF